MTRDLTQQSGNSLNTVTGTILDPVGVIIPGAEVTITGEVTGKSVKTSTNDKGQFLVAGLGPGTYKITVKCQGFKELRIVDVKLKNNENLNLDVALELATTSVTVGIIGYEPLIDSPGTLTINEKMIQRLPIH